MSYLRKLPNLVHEFAFILLLGIPKWPVGSFLSFWFIRICYHFFLHCSKTLSFRWIDVFKPQLSCSEYIKQQVWKRWRLNISYVSYHSELWIFMTDASFLTVTYSLIIVAWSHWADFPFWGVIINRRLIIWLIVSTATCWHWNVQETLAHAFFYSVKIVAHSVKPFAKASIVQIQKLPIIVLSCTHWIIISMNN